MLMDHNHAGCGHSFDIPSDCTAELSPRGYQFFTDIFESFDQVTSPAVEVLSARYSHPNCLFNKSRAHAGPRWRFVGF